MTVPDTKTANTFTKFIQKALDPEAPDWSNEENDLLNATKFSKPIVNNFVATLPDGMQYNIQIKKVS